jgi:lipopolysaccharide export system protein LptC
MNLRFLGLFITLALIVSLTAWLQNTADIPQDNTPAISDRHTTDFYMEAYDATVMDERGQPSHRIISPKLVHFADDDTTELETPYMTMYREKGQPWKISAKRGWIAAKNEHILLSGDVLINRSKGPVNEAMTLETERLRIRPDDDYAETDTKITMRTEKQRTVANGMRAYLAKGQIQLLDKVKTRYEN